MLSFPVTIFSSFQLIYPISDCVISKKNWGVLYETPCKKHTGWCWAVAEIRKQGLRRTRKLQQLMSRLSKLKIKLPYHRILDLLPIQNKKQLYIINLLESFLLWHFWFFLSLLEPYKICQNPLFLNILETVLKIKFF